MNECMLSIDQGTTNTKVLLVGRDGRPLFRASCGLSLQHPRAGWAEQDPEALWGSVQTAIGACMDWLGGGTGRASVAGVAVTNQRETALAWERESGRALGPAISWQCRRSEAVCGRLAGSAETVRARSGLVLDPLLSASKWAWLLEKDGTLARRAEQGEICLGTVDSWLLWKLTGGEVHATDTTNAARTGLLNLRTLAWDPELLHLFGIPRQALPEVCPSGGEFGRCVHEGLHEVPLVAVLGDSHAALLGHGGAPVKATYGTGSSVMALTPGVPEARMLAGTVAWSTAAEVQYAVEGNISMAGAGVQWVAEFLGHPLDEVLGMAGSVDDAGGVVFVPAMAGLGAPHWDTRARGMVCGLETGSRAAHLARAAVEAIAFQVRDVFEAMGVREGVALRADGGATRNDALMQMQADVLGRPVERSRCEELSALGAAWMGGVTLGWWADVGALASLPEPVTTFYPRMPFGERERRLDAWRAAVASACLMEVGA